MSTDQDVTIELVETLEDGRRGYEMLAEKLKDSPSSAIEGDVTRLADQRRQMSDELRGMAASYGDPVDASGTAAAAVHRGWIALKDAVTGADPKALLQAALLGEDHAINKFEAALEEDLSSTLRDVVAGQLVKIRAARDEVKALAEH